MPVSYDAAIIALSVVIAMGSYVSLTLARRLASLGLGPLGDDPGGRSAARRKALLAASALSLGVGIWAMHFIGMLAVKLPVAVTYDILWTLVSALVCILVVGLGVFVASFGRLHPRRLAVAGLLMGVKAKFQGAITLSDLDPPRGYTIRGEGKGGAAGFAKGGARVRLEAASGGTVLHYEVQADVGGKLAQLGSRLIDGTAKKLSTEFFTRFGGIVAASAEGAQLAEAAPKADMAPVGARAARAAIVPDGLSLVWLTGLIVAVAALAGYILFSG